MPTRAPRLWLTTLVTLCSLLTGPVTQANILQNGNQGIEKRLEHLIHIAYGVMDKLDDLVVLANHWGEEATQLLFENNPFATDTQVNQAALRAVRTSTHLATVTLMDRSTKHDLTGYGPFDPFAAEVKEAEQTPATGASLNPLTLFTQQTDPNALFPALSSNPLGPYKRLKEDELKTLYENAGGGSGATPPIGDSGAYMRQRYEALDQWIQGGEGTTNLVGDEPAILKSRSNANNKADYVGLYHKFIEARSHCIPNGKACELSNHHRLQLVQRDIKNALLQHEFSAAPEDALGDAKYNPDSLLLHDSYADTTLPNLAANTSLSELIAAKQLHHNRQKYAAGFLQTLSQLATLPTSIDNDIRIPNPLTQGERDAISDPKRAHYQKRIEQQKIALARLIRGALVAKNVGLNNFVHMYAVRKPQNEVRNLGLKDSHGNAITSMRQLQRYMAERRLQPEYISTMQTASPVTVSREILLTLAEIQHQLLVNNLQQERLLATLSVMQLADVQKVANDAVKLKGVINRDINNFLNPESDKYTDMTSSEPDESGRSEKPETPETLPNPM